MNALRGINPHIRLLASSGLRGRGRDPHVIAGAQEFLPKPYSDSQLLGAIRRALKSRNGAPAAVAVSATA
jgi:CheY-like chemotaxis protein